MTITPPQILKGRIPSPTGERIPRAEFEAIRAAERALTDARDAAQRILTDARREAEALRAEARRAGREEGRRALAQAELALRAEASRMRQEAGERLIRLAGTLARQVLDRELQSGPEAIRALVRKALSQVAWCRQAVLRLHPADAEALTEHQPELSRLVSSGAELTLQPDGELARGDCILETDAGTVDGSVRTQLEALERALLRAPEDPDHVR